MVNLCEKYDATVIQQLYKVVTGDNGELTTKKAFPVSLIQSTFDAGTGTRLDQILALNNCVWLPFAGDKESTRLQVESGMRREGLIVVFKNSDGEIYSQMYVGKDSVSDDEWKSDSKWKDVFVSSSSLGIVDSLTSDSSTEALSARQGKILDEKISALKSMDVRVVDSLPEKGSSGVIYLIKNDKSTSKSNTYKEYIWMSDEGKYEELGTFGDITVDTELSETSENPVQNKAVTSKINELEMSIINFFNYPIIEVTTESSQNIMLIDNATKVTKSTGTVTNYTWAEIQKLVRMELPVRMRFDNGIVFSIMGVDYESDSDTFEGWLSEQDRRREFKINKDLSVEIADRFYPEKFIIEVGAESVSDNVTTYPVTSDSEIVKDCVTAFSGNASGNDILVNVSNTTITFSVFSVSGNSLTATSSDHGKDYTLTLIIDGNSSLKSSDTVNDFVRKEDIPDLTKVATKDEIPTKTSQLDNDSNFVDQTILSNFVEKDGDKQLSDENFTKELKERLDSIESGAQKNVTPDWNAKEGEEGYILNKPSSIGGSLDYSEITNKPTINGVVLEGDKSVDDLGLASKTDVPAKTSQLENDSNFLTEHQKLKTVNGESLVGEGDIKIEGGSSVTVDSDLSDSSENPVQNKVITAALTELQDYCFPTSLEATVSPSSAEWTGASVEVSVGYKILRNSKAVTADAVTINFNGETKSLENVSSGSEKFVITTQGYKTGSVSAKKGTTTIKNSPRSISVNLYLPVYYGFSKATGNDIVITDLTKGGASINGTRTLSNDDATKYLWLCVPSSMSISKVTSSGFDVPFLAPVEASTTLGSYKCYRTQDLPGSGDMTIVIS